MDSTDIRGIPLEVAVYDPGNALRAEVAGAHRLQINAKDSHSVGGLTPSIEDLKRLHRPNAPGIKKLDVPVRIHIRPRAAPGPDAEEQQDFIYSDEEFEEMRNAITEFKNLGTLNPLRGDAFVFRILERVGTGAKESERELAVDVRRCTMLVELALPIRCCFSRAFDAVAGPRQWRGNMNEVFYSGFTGVLTAGGPGSFVDNIENLVHICNQMPDLQLIVGGGVRASNIKRLLSRLEDKEQMNIWVHSPCHYLPSERLSDSADPSHVSTVEVAALRRECGIVDPEWFSPQGQWRQIYH
ncbi:copper homeostasis CutC domain-containing protein [Mariannaea sp. PMI_226]|nr:copper homeostasis CutC domain-containing protein [Mariannaea sp. PMI_226]